MCTLLSWFSIWSFENILREDINYRMFSKEHLTNFRISNGRSFSAVWPKQFFFQKFNANRYWGFRYVPTVLIVASIKRKIPHWLFGCDQIFRSDPAMLCGVACFFRACAASWQRFSAPATIPQWNLCELSKQTSSNGRSLIMFLSLNMCDTHVPSFYTFPWKCSATVELQYPVRSAKPLAVWRASSCKRWFNRSSSNLVGRPKRGACLT